MSSATRKAFVLVIGLLGLLQVGCLEKTLFPPILLTVESVTAYENRPTKPTNASDPITLSQVAVALRADSQVPAKVTGFSVQYKTVNGEGIPELAIRETAMNQVLTTGGTTNINLSPYTQRVLDLFYLSESNISPITATMMITVADENNNVVRKEANCLLFKPWWW